MKRILSIQTVFPSLGLIACLGICGSVQAASRVNAELQETLSATQILELRRAAMGSEEALAAAQFLLLEGTLEFEGGGGRGLFSELYAADGRAFISTQIPGLPPHDQGFDGEVFWEEDMRAGARRRDALQANVAQRKFGTLRGAKWSDLYVSASVIGTETIADRKCFVLSMIPNVGRADRWYIDAKTYRLSQLVMLLSSPSGEPLEFQTSFSNWREVDGIEYPLKRVIVAGGTRLTRTVTSLSHEEGLSKARFAAPMAVAGGEGLPGSLPRLRKIASQAVLSVKLTCTPQELGIRMGAAVKQVSEQLGLVGAKAAGPPFTRYHRLGQEAIEIEAGIPILSAVAAIAPVELGELPAGEVLTLWHYGPLQGIPLSYAKLEAALKEFQREPNGGQWEVYWTPPGRAEQDSIARTQIVLPVRKIKVTPKAASAKGEAGEEADD